MHLHPSVINYCSLNLHKDGVHLSATNTLFHTHIDYPTQPITRAREKVSSECERYWKEIDYSLKNIDVADGNTDEVERFYDEMVTQGGSLRRTLLSETMSEQLRVLAKTAERLVLITDMPYIPWEALYFGTANEGEFLGDITTIVRMLKHEKPGPARYQLNEDVGAVVLVDPCLDEDIKRKYLTALDLDVFETSTISDLRERVRCSRTILWICDNETEGKGLRLKEDLYYNSDTAFFHLFPEDSTLFLAACKAAAGGGARDTCIAGKIQFASGCTVIAPASVLVTEAGFRIIREMAELLREAPSGTTVIDFWKQLTSGTTNLLDNGLSKFFCMYGDTDHVLKR